MWDTGAYNSSNGITFTDIAAAEVTEPCSIAVYWETPGSASALRPIFGKHNGTNGFQLRGYSGTSYQNRVNAGLNNGSSTPSVSTQYSIVGSYDGANVDMYLDGSADGTPTETGTPAYSTEPVSIGYNGTTGTTAGGYMGQPMLWNTTIGAAGATLYHAKAVIPNFSNLKFWAKGKVELADAMIPVVSATEQGTVGMHADAAVDDAFPVTASDPVYWLIGSYWGPLLASAAAFGANLFCQPQAEMTRMAMHMIRTIGCNLPDWTETEFRQIWHATNQYNPRRVYGFTGG